MNGLSTDWFSFYYNSNTFNQISSLDGQHWISELSNDHGLGTFPMQTSGANLGFYPPVTTNQEYWFQTYGDQANLDQGGTSIGHFDSPQDYSGISSTATGGEELGGRRWNTGHPWYSSVDASVQLEPNNVPPQYYELGDKLQYPGA